MGMDGMQDDRGTAGAQGSRHRLVTLTALLTLTAVATGAVGIFFMYQMVLQQTRDSLSALAEGEARLVQILAAQQGAQGQPERLWQVLEVVLPDVAGLTEQGVEIVVLRQETGKVYRVWSRSSTAFTLHDAPGMVLGAFDSLAIAYGRGGGAITVRGADGRRMMAAYTPIPSLEAGVVAQVPVRTIIQPLFAATAGSMGVAFMVILLGAGLFMRKLNPVLLRTERDEARLRSVLSSAAEGIITIDEGGIIVDFNRAAEEIFGYSPAEAIGQPLDLIIPSPYRAKHQGFIAEYLAGGEAKRLRQRAEFAGRRRDGTPFIMELAVSEAWVGKRRLFTGIVSDITARRAAEDALYEAKAELERRVSERTAELSRYNRMLQAIHEIQNAYFSSVSSHDVFAYALQRLCDLTGSNSGLLAELGPSSGTMPCWCYLAVHQPESVATVAGDIYWQRVLEEESSVVVNSPPLLLAPLKSTGEVVGIAVVAGPAESYLLELAESLEPYLNVCGTLIHQAQLRAATEMAGARLKDAERRLHDIVSNVQDVIFRTDLQGTVQWISPSVGTLSGRAAEQIIGWNITRYMVEHGVMERLHDALRQGGGTVSNFEVRLRHADGGVFWVSANCHYMRHANGEPTGIEGVMRDVTAYKQAMQRIGELNRLYGVLRETNRAVVDVTGRERLYQTICRSLTTTGGFLMAWIGELDTGQHRVVPVTYDGFEHGYLQALRAIALADPAQGQGPTAQAVLNNEIRVINDIATDPVMEPWRDAALGRGYRSLVALPFHANGRVAGALVVYAEAPGYFTSDMLSLLDILVDDISHALDVQGKEQERQETTVRLRDLAIHLESVRECERAHLAREIHDDLGGLLTAVKMDLAWLKRRCTPHEERMAEKMSDVARLADTAIQSMRRIITELRPAILDDLGLIPAVEWQLNEFGRRSGIKTELHLGLAPDVSSMPFPSTLAVAAFRTLQEALTNVLKHAQAERVVVDTRMEGDDFVLKIADDGQGVGPEQLRKSGSYGVLGMRERAHSLGGSLDIHSQPGAGLTVVLRLPLPTLPAADEVMS